MKILITGGGGFLGTAIVRLLINEGHACRCVARNDYPHLRAMGAKQICGDLSDMQIADQAVEGCEAIFHVAAKAGVWGKHEDYFQANVIATKNILKAAEKYSVKYLIYTSTPSVTFNGSDIENGAQSLPYAENFLTSYARTKAEAEKMVLAHPFGKTIALRPHLIYGPGDPHLLPRLIEKHRRGKIKRVGDGKNKVDLTYVDNAASAHIQALHAFRDGNDLAHAKAYFISDDSPVNIWDFLNRSLKALGYTSIDSSISHKTARRVGALLETFHTYFRPQIEPRMTRFVADNLATSHWYDMAPAQKDFGYLPIVSQEDAFEAMVKDLRERGFESEKKIL